MNRQKEIKEQLRKAGFKATPARVALLSLLTKEIKPLDVISIIKKISVNVDQATIYRALRSLVEAGLVKQLGIRSGIAHYEIASLPHHHHLICEKCGLIEDVKAHCDNPKLAGSSFRRVTQHHLEYFGICVHCAK